MTTGARKTSYGEEYDAKALGENVRDLDSSVKAGLRWSKIELLDFYREPMQVGSFEREPEMIIVRVRRENAPEVPLLSSATVHYVFDAGSVRVLSIDGMTPSNTEKYYFNFLVAEL